MTHLPFVSGSPPTERDCAASPHDAEDQAFVDAISWLGDGADDEDEE